VAVTFEQSVSRSGKLDLDLDASLAAELLPSLSRWMPLPQLAVLLATTRLIGMECPGLHSMFTGLEGQFSSSMKADGESAGALLYRVTDADERYSMLTIEIQSSVLTGHLQAMLRPAPVRQPSFPAIRARTKGEEFVGQRALILGGSRGLGEVTAKLIAGGGGEAWITYATGFEDATRVAQEIEAHRGRARVLRFDVLKPPTALSSELTQTAAPTHFYFFATPHIALNKTGTWDDELFGCFCSFYVSGLERSIRTIRSWWGDVPLLVYYPSTAFLDEPEPGAAEYAAAKGAGETVCRYIQASCRNVRCHVSRLPRMLTDQTNARGLDRELMPEAAAVLLDAFAGIPGMNNEEANASEA